MKFLPFIFALFAPILAWSADTNIRPVQVTTNGVLVSSVTNFFSANSNLLNSAVSSSASVAGKLDATNGIASGLRNINGFENTGDAIMDRVSGTSFDRRNSGTASRVAAWASDNTLTNSASVDLTELGYLDGLTGSLTDSLNSKLIASGGTATNLTVTGTIVAELIQFDSALRSQLTDNGTVTIWDSNGVLTNSSVTDAQLVGLLTLGTGNGVTTFNSVDDLTTLANAATSTNGVPPSTFVRGYWAAYPGVGAGMWRFDPDSRRPVSRSSIFVGSTGQFGRFHPVFVSGRINVEQLGAVDGLLDSYATDDVAFTNAWSLQQDPNWNDKTLFVPSGEFQISSSLSQYHQGTISTAYTVNGAHPTNSTTITVQSGSGSYLPGSSVTFSGHSKKYVVVSHDGATTLVIQSPGLTTAVSDLATITINTPVRPIVSGVARAGSYNNYREGSTIIMTDLTKPVFEVGYEEGLIEKLNIRHGVVGSSTLAYATDANAAGILALSGKNVYRYVFRDLSFRGNSRAIYFPASGSTTSPNNSFENIWVMSGSIGCLHFGKSGTINRFSNIYVQNHGNAPGANVSSGVSAISGNGTDTMNLTLDQSINLLTVGGYVEISGVGTTTPSGVVAEPNTVFFVTALTTNATGGVLSVQSQSVSHLFQGLSRSSSTLIQAKARAANTEALVFLGQNFMSTFDALDIESTRGPSTGAAGTPALLDNRGQTIIDYFHGENVQLQVDGHAFIRNDGGTLRIGQASLLNIGMTQGITNYFFYNERPSSVRSGQFTVESVSIRDISNIPTTPGVFMLAEKSSANGGASAVVIDNYIPMPTVRFNAKSTWPIGVANTRPKTSGAQLGYSASLPSTTLLEPIYHYGFFEDTSNYRRASIAQDANGLLVIDSNGLGSLYSTNNSIEIRVNGTNRLGISKSGSVSVSDGALLRLGSGASAGASINSPTDGAVLMQNFAGGDFGRLQFGGTDASFPAIKRSSATLQAVLANDTGFAPIQSLYIRFGAGTPEGSVAAPIGALYSRTDGGASTSLYVKESGTGNTGWVAK